MARTRDYRRYQLELRKQRVRKRFRRYDWFGGKPATDTQVGRTARTPHPCSCWGCGNPRKHFAQLTRQEMRAKEDSNYFHQGC